MPAASSVANVLAATPGCDFIPAPTSDTFPRSSRAAHFTPRASSALSASGRSSTGAEKTISPPVCRIVSTLTFASASAPKSCAALAPETRYTVSSRWCTTPEISAFSIVSSSSRIHVPSESLKVERTWSLTLWLRATSIERVAITRAPDEAISSISSKLRTSSLCAFGTSRGSAL